MTKVFMKRTNRLKKACNVENPQHLKYDQVSGLNEFFLLNSICKSKTRQSKIMPTLFVPPGRVSDQDPHYCGLLDTYGSGSRREK
jgi:hypothetical protein